MSNLEQLASLLARRNAIDEEIVALIGRPAIRGHVGEWIALVEKFREQKRRLGVASYVRKNEWEAASVYPAAAHGRLGDVLRRTSGRFLASLTRCRGRRRLWPDGGIRPDTDRIDDGYPASGNGHAVALCDNDDEAEVVGDEPIHCRERRPGAAGSRGSRGRSVPLPSSQCTHIG